MMGRGVSRRWDHRGMGPDTIGPLWGSFERGVKRSDLSYSRIVLESLLRVDQVRGRQCQDESSLWSTNLTEFFPWPLFSISSSPPLSLGPVNINAQSAPSSAGHLIDCAELCHWIHSVHPIALRASKNHSLFLMKRTWTIIWLNCSVFKIVKWIIHREQ